ncbi:hypothetical protein J7E79_27485 [Bacillus sp. ISL-40]|uniref:Ig-like domain-containing protein n=1 Tax=unclassified Bacillus (in: firmicutes) TaxID=185979 RepID=UPI001BE68FC4|nr:MULTISPECIES: Ig-like domain-containing protein [unclassified Bacillus (in: firmicutes)]MBT2701037.1 hypothetical protein [Bacillus sp. ISL-40]MBT2739307.1 hypothetical protein [Bacillus sp. ISL-77]
MKRKSILIFIVMFYLLSISLGSIPAKASTINGILSISVEEKNILIPDYQTIKVNLEDSTGVSYIQVGYKLPSEGYTGVQLYRNSTGSFEGDMPTFYNDAGNWNVSDIIVFYNSGGFRFYEDIAEGGSYELDDGNYTVYSSDTTGPILDNISIDNSNILVGGSATVTFDVHDELSDIQSVRATYRSPDNYYINMETMSVGDNQFQLILPYYLTGGMYGIGKYDCVSITLRDSKGNETTLEDYSYYSTRDLSGGDFIVKPEADAPVVKNISVDKKEIPSGDSVKLTAEVEDASGVSDVKVVFHQPSGMTYTAILSHSYGDVYEGEVPSYATSNVIGNWTTHFVWVNDIYGNSSYIWSNLVYSWGQDLSNGNFLVKERDITPPDSPTAYGITEDDSWIYGYTEPGSLVQARLNGSVIGSGYADSYYGFYQIYIGKQNAKSTIYIIATDSSGNTSQATSLYVRDVTPPAKPDVSQFDNSSNYVSGWAESGSTVNVLAGGNIIGSGITYSGGYFFVYVPYQKAGTELTITASDDSGNVSEPAKIVVLDRTSPQTPVLAEEVTDQSSIVKGQAEAGSQVEVRSSGTVIGSSTADQNGNFTINIPGQLAGTELYILSTDSSGNTSSIMTSVKDATPPIKPTVNEVTDKDTSVSGLAESGANVEVKVNGEVLGSTAVDSVGNFTIIIPGQTAGTELTFTATDKAGNVGESTTIVVKDVTSPAKPVVYEVTEKDASVTGKAEAGSKVEIKVNSSVVGSGTAGTEGKFSITIPVQKAGTQIVITATDKAGNVSETTTVVVKDVTSPTKPVVNEVTEKDVSVTGKAEAGSKVEIKVNSSVVGSGTAGTDGKFSITIPVQKAGTQIVITAADNAGNVSETTTVVVKDVTSPAKPIVNEVTDKDTSISGQVESGSKVEFKVNGSVIGLGTAGTEGRFSITIPLQKAGTQIAITAADKAGNVSETTTVVVKDVTFPAKPGVNEVTDKDTSVSGQAESGSKVEIKVNGTMVGSGTAGTNGKFSISIRVQKAGSILLVTAKDAAGNISTAKTVIVVDKTAPLAPLVNSVTDKAKEVNGKAEASATVIVMIGTKKYQAKADIKGNYKISIPQQKAGTKLTITAADAAGNISAAKTVIVIDKTAPLAPIVNTVTDKAKEVNGKAEAAATVTVMIGTKKYYAKADVKGNYKISIPQQKAGTKVTITVTDAAGNVSTAKSVIVLDKTPPSAPKVNTVKSTTTTVTGKAEANATIKIKVGSKEIGKAAADKNGNYKVKIKAQRKNTLLSITATDIAKNVSRATNLKVK